MEETPVIAGKTVPPPSKIESLKAIIKLEPKRAQHNFGVFSYSLNRDVVKADGTPDDLYGMIFFLGSFDTQEKAEKHIQEVIEKTKHTNVFLSRYAKAFPLSLRPNPDHTQQVYIEDGKIKELESQQYKHEKAEYEKRIKIEEDIVKEAENETNPEHLEHFKRLCYLAIKNHATFLHHEKEAKKAKEFFEKRKVEISKHYQAHPEHDSQWLPVLKEKLLERGESLLYNSIEAAYKELRSELLGLTSAEK